MGRLTKKTQCQLRACVSRPPARRPSEPPATETNTYAPMARARSTAPGNSVTMIARITDAWAAAPTPWSRRAPISSAWVEATPQSSDAAVKMTRPARKTRRRPRRSPRRPARSSRLPNVTRNPLTTHVRFAWLKPRSCWIAGSATFTIVTSRTIMSCAKQTMISVAHRRRSSDGLRGGGASCKGDTSLSRESGKMEATSEISGGHLQNYTEAPSVLSSDLHDSTERPRRAPQARGRAAQLREGAGRCARGVRRGRRVDRARGDRAPRGRRDRHALPPLPESPGAARGPLRRRGRGALPLGRRARRRRPVGGARAPGSSASSATSPPSRRSPAS